MVVWIIGLSGAGKTTLANDILLKTRKEKNNVVLIAGDIIRGAFDIDLGLIRQQDEDYWDEYRTTPKAFISLSSGRQLWESRWGSLTSIRMLSNGNMIAEADRFRVALRNAIDPLSLGFVVYPARSLALEASSGTTDFGLYFIYFSFFYL